MRREERDDPYDLQKMERDGYLFAQCSEDALDIWNEAQQCPLCHTPTDWVCVDRDGSVIGCLCCIGRG